MDRPTTCIISASWILSAVEVRAAKGGDVAEWERIRRPGQIGVSRESGEAGQSVRGNASDDVEKGEVRIDGDKEQIGKVA